MGSNWKPIPESLSPEELVRQLAQQMNVWARDKDRFESAVTTPTSKRSGGSTIALTREQIVDISRVGMLAGVTGSVADEPFITVNNTAGLNAERALAVADPINKTDNGVNSTLILGVSYAAPSITLGAAGATGSSSRPIRSDATIAAFDGVTPEGVSTSASTGSNAFAARSDHVHDIGTDVAVVSKLTSANSTVTLTDDAAGTSQTLTGNYGDLHIVGQSAIVLNSRMVQGVSNSAFLLNDLIGNGASSDRTSGMLLRLVNHEGVSSYIGKETAFAVSAGALPKVIAYRPGASTTAWFDVNNMQWATGIDNTGLPSGDAGMALSVAGGNATWASKKTNLIFDQRATGGPNETIKFRHPDADNAASTTALFQFEKQKAFTSSLQNFLECAVNGSTGFAMNQSMRPMLKDANGATFTIIGISSTNTANRTLWMNLANADRYLTIQGNPTLDDWFEQSVKFSADVVFNSITTNDDAAIVMNTGGGGNVAISPVFGLTQTGDIHFSHGGLSGISFTLRASVIEMDQSVMTTSGVTFSSADVTNDLRARQCIADGDNAGLAATNSLTNGVTSPGANTPAFVNTPTGITSNQGGWLKVYAGTSAAYIPVWW